MPNRVAHRSRLTPHWLAVSGAPKRCRQLLRVQSNQRLNSQFFFRWCAMELESSRDWGLRLKVMNLLASLLASASAVFG